MGSWRDRVAPLRGERQRYKDATSGKFKINLFVSKAYEDEKGDWYVEGIASGTRLDLQGDRMTPECIADMASQINSGQIPFCTTHWDSDWNEEIGYLVEGSVDPADQLFVRVWLDKTMPNTVTLWRKLHGVPESGIPARKLGMSIGGFVKTGHSEQRDGEWQYVIEKLQLVHTVPTSMPAYPDAAIQNFFSKNRAFAQDWMGAIFKAVSPRQSAPGGTVDHAQGRSKGGYPMTEEEKRKAKEAEAAAEKAKQDEAAKKAKSEDGEDGAGEGGGEGGDGGEKQQEPKGQWKRAGDIEEEDLVWCQMPAAAAPAPSGDGGESSEEDKSQGGDDMIGKKQFEELEARVKAHDEKLDEILKAVKGEKPEGDQGDDAQKQKSAGTEGAKQAEAGKGGEQQGEREKGERRGQRDVIEDEKEKSDRMRRENEDGDDWLKKLKASPEFQKASRLEQMDMLDQAVTRKG
ncbi:MAG: hypothetical protein ACE15D_18755 [Candidatus Eisenbacteria bacterium]